MRGLARPAADAVIGPRERDQRVAHVLETARIEERRARRAARAPILLDPAFRRQAEIGVEGAVRHLPELLLGEDRYLAPFVGIVEPVRAYVVELARVEWRALCLLECEALALPLDGRDLRAGFR